MFRKCVSVVGGLSLVVAAFAIGGHHARGAGFIAVGEGHRGNFRTEVHKQGDAVRGSLGYRDATADHVFIEARIPEVRRAAFEEHVVEYGGPGVMNGRPVMIQARAFDGGPKGDDRFNIVIKGREGQVVYHAEGVVRDGDVVIRHD